MGNCCAPLSEKAAATEPGTANGVHTARLDVKYAPGPLGIVYEGNRVVEVKPGGQSAKGVLRPLRARFVCTCSPSSNSRARMHVDANAQRWCASRDAGDGDRRAASARRRACGPRAPRAPQKGQRVLHGALRSRQNERGSFFFQEGGEGVKLLVPMANAEWVVPTRKHPNATSDRDPSDAAPRSAIGARRRHAPKKKITDPRSDRATAPWTSRPRER